MTRLIFFPFDGTFDNSNGESSISAETEIDLEGIVISVTSSSRVHEQVRSSLKDIVALINRSNRNTVIA